MMIFVRKSHIEKGEKKNHFYNPIALAIAELDPFAVVTDCKVHVRDGIKVLPMNAQVWLRDFNAEKRVQPTEFFLL